MTFLAFLAGCGPAAAEKLLFVPLDNRPVSLEYTVESFRKAGVTVETPPLALLSSDRQNGDPDKLLQWLDAHAKGADGAVVSTDSLIYGGLVPSRTHELSESTLEARTKALLAFKTKHPGVPLYGFATIMRSPKWSSAPAEPAYYGQYGPKLFQWGALRDRNRLGLLKKKEKKKLQQLEAEIPADIRKDLLDRRWKNLTVLRNLADGLGQGSLDYLLLGRDDSAPYSEAHRDAAVLLEGVDKAYGYKLRSFSGADELGMTLLNRALNKARGVTPLVYAYYNEGKGPETVASYEDSPIRTSYRQHVLAAGGYPAQFDKRADLVLGIYTPFTGVTVGADTAANTDALDEPGQRFLTRTRDYVNQGRNVGLADIAFGNGGSNALVKGLFEAPKQDPLGYQLGSYAGWNTASNSLGYALGQGLLRPYLSDADRKDLLTVRYLDDWAYQSNVRQEVRQELVWPQKWTDGKLTDDQTEQAEQLVKEKMKTTAEPVLGKKVEQYEYKLPWHRTFEIDVKKK
ncbi:DUF4127 family protein [Acidaminococcus timonensis]|uniref:DUF4127 family protein n=1 Tax=Acidaminococcus timonensis TaxID=1871002 RepID=UPI0026F27A2C|nr:DUF4127 family protein [Acidaminococcus timonensis]